MAIAMGTVAGAAQAGLGASCGAHIAFLFPVYLSRFKPKAPFRGVNVSLCAAFDGACFIYATLAALQSMPFSRFHLPKRASSMSRTSAYFSAVSGSW